ncbi:MAG: amidase [Betaproteobacteria bacterium]|nr:amidase [Betaproteobacteria bacterium]MSQ87842.1 amidase [Betaproteobacteria bacterium]
MNDTAILELSCTALAGAIRDRQLSAVKAMETVLARAQTVQPKLNAFLRIDTDLALDAARLADKDLARGHLRGPLHGVPMAHKDMYYRKGLASSYGGKIGPTRPAPATATALARLDVAGAIQFGVLNMAEFAFGPTGHNYHYGHCRNAWNPDYITGGSSSGSGTAVAARATYAALGSDTGGSIRLPATFCGTSGIKPTYARVSRAGAMPLSFSMDTVGPLARTVEDCALILATIAGPDARDPTSDPRPVPDYLSAMARPVAGLTIGRPRQYFYDACDPEIAALMDASLESFRSIGAKVVDVDLPDLEAWNAACAMIISAEAAALHGNWLRTRAQDYSAQVRARLEQGLAIPATAYLDSLRLRGVALEEFCRSVFSKVDVLHAPVVAFQTPTIAQTDVGGGPKLSALMAQVTRLTRPANYLGVPVLSLQAGFTRAGLPVGMQLLGRPFDEATLFALGNAYQSTSDFHRLAPTL